MNKTNGITTSRQHFANKLRTIKALKLKRLLLGWTDGAKDNRGNSYAVIARTLEYGRDAGVSAKTGRKYPAIPPRDFIGQFYSRFSGNTRARMRKALKHLHDADKLTLQLIDEELMAVGNVGIGDLQQTIVNGAYMANAPATIKSWLRNKSKSKIAKLVKQNPSLAPTSGKKPLIATGQMIQHITYKIE